MNLLNVNQVSHFVQTEH